MSYGRYGRTLLCDNAGVMSEVLAQFKLDKPKKTVWGNFRITEDSITHTSSEMREVNATSKDTDRVAKILAKLKSGAYEWHASNKRPMELGIAEFKKAIKDKQWREIKYSVPDVDVIAVKIKTETGHVFVGNSSILSGVGRTVAYGNVQNKSRLEKLRRKFRVN